jgi:hypothetical protein
MLILLWLLLAVPQVPGGGTLYPPDNVVLLHRSPTFTMRWKLPGKKFQADLYHGGKLMMSQVLSQSSWTVAISPGASYTWMITPLQEVPPVTRAARFSVIDVPEYNSHGRDGGPGQKGTPGGQIQADLRRDGAGMNLFVTERNRTMHYLFSEPGIRFRISARGGVGGDGKPGLSFRMPRQCVGGPGGGGGWGGSVRIITHTAPWREYLDVDVSAGQPGAGGAGGEYYDDEKLVKAPDGPPGQPGKAGTVQTIIDP